jgi:hypothetical protein
MIKIHRVGVLSLATVSAVLYALFGLLGGLFMTGINLLGMIFTGAARSAYSSYGSSFDFLGIITGLGAVVCLPIVYGALGFIGGLIGGLFLNLALKITHGLEIEAAVFNLSPAPPKENTPKIEPLSPLPQ